MKKRINLYLDELTIERLRNISLAEFGRVSISRTIDFLMGVSRELRNGETYRDEDQRDREKVQNETKEGPYKGD